MMYLAPIATSTAAESLLSLPDRSTPPEVRQACRLAARRRCGPSEYRAAAFFPRLQANFGPPTPITGVPKLDREEGRSMQPGKMLPVQRVLVQTLQADRQRTRVRTDVRHTPFQFGYLSGRSHCELCTRLGPAAANGGSGSAPLAEPRGEETVQSVALRPGAKEPIRIDEAADRLRQVGRYGIDSKVVVPVEKSGHDIVVLLPHHRASRVDEHTFRLDESGHRIEKLRLKGRKLRDVLRRSPPADLGMLAQRAEPRARGIDENRIEWHRLAQGQRS